MRLLYCVYSFSLGYITTATLQIDFARHHLQPHSPHVVDGGRTVRTFALLFAGLGWPRLHCGAPGCLSGVDPTATSAARLKLTEPFFAGQPVSYNKVAVSYMLWRATPGAAPATLAKSSLIKARAADPDQLRVQRLRMNLEWIKTYPSVHLRSIVDIYGLCPTTSLYFCDDLFHFEAG